jgi:tRNA pseudouridine55 synthase
LEHQPPNKIVPEAESREPEADLVPKAESREPRAELHGVLVIDKPQGPTSHDIVAVARRALREKRIGHTGTLDPMATGVLPLVLGKATRLAALLSSDEKSYDAAVRLGEATATYDAAERIAAGTAPPIAPDVQRADIDRVVERFRGSFDQVPPPFSAKKLGGTPAYKLARKDQAPALAPVRVTVHALEVLGYEDGLLRLRVQSSSGFYVRSLAHDIGVQLGCGAHLEGLRRTRAGTFTLDGAVTVDELTGRPDIARERTIPLRRLLTHIPAALLNAQGARKASHGNPLALSDLRETGSGTIFGTRVPEEQPMPSVRLLDPDGELIGIAKLAADGLLRPYVVLV